MATIERRVRLLTDVLLDRGFGWLAAEIIAAIEAGIEDSDDIDSAVSLQRSTLNSKIASGNMAVRSQPEDLKHSATRHGQLRRGLAPDDQVRVAVDLLIDRLSAAAKMTEKSIATLSELMEAPVSLSVQVGDTVQSINPQEAQEAGEILRESRAEFAQWLLAWTAPGDV